MMVEPRRENLVTKRELQIIFLYFNSCSLSGFSGSNRKRN